MDVRKQLGRDVLLEDLKKSLSLQQELYQKVEEFPEMYSETLSEAYSGIEVLKICMDELTEKLRLSNESKDLVMVRLQAVMDDIHNLNEYKANCTAKSNDMAMQNQILEAKLASIMEENSLLLMKVADREAIELVCKCYQRQYEACLAEKKKLSIPLNQEASVSKKMKSLFSMKSWELSTEISELNSLKENLQETVSFTQDKVASLLASYDKHFTGLPLLSDTHSLDSKTELQRCCLAIGRDPA
ncbi:hypothetical protein ACH5RR_026760 [Cinchona calisaya]|uniref:Uncharacterized protein n=1 Tax=Cinchona calisaya TaxID=153742 RepID=A0ABD2Z4J2_9GENT